MPFMNEIPTAEDIEKYGLPYKNDINLDMSRRRQWTVDHEHNFGTLLWSGDESFKIF